MLYFYQWSAGQVSYYKKLLDSCLVSWACQIAIQQYPSVCLSIKQARFVTMGAIDLLLCEEVPLGQVTWQNQKSVPYDFFPGL
jgi:hypothetical protein